MMVRWFKEDERGAAELHDSVDLLPMQCRKRDER
jgi:hypothetical protein